MTAISVTAKILSERLPELVWKLNQTKLEFNPKLLPRGLFKERTEMTSQSCIDEINASLMVLKKSEKNGQSARYLAERISQQINVLVRLCQIHQKKERSPQTITLSLQSISTHQQWLRDLEDEIDKLRKQQEALIAAMGKLKAEHDLEAVLQLQADIGEIEQRLRLATEAFERGV